MGVLFFDIASLFFDLILLMLQCCVLLNIEGTTTPLSFVSNILFAYAHDNVEKHLAATFDIKETQDDIHLLRSQVSFFFCHLLL